MPTGEARNLSRRSRAARHAILRYGPEQQRRADVAQMVERGAMFDHALEHVWLGASFLDELDGELADLGSRVVELGEHKLDEPVLVCRHLLAKQLAELVRC
jgi:hypothetical protein